jgi:endonuclease/exonuclease/phosphatase (EEP) superfamily protein YafD
LWVIGIAVVIIMGPISGGVVSPDALFESADAERLRILTCNTDGNSLSRERFELLLSEAAPDIVVLQECNPNRVNDLFPKTWSQCIGPGGIRIASRFRVKNCEYLREKELGMQGIVGRYQLETPAGDLPVVNIHLPTPRNGFEFLVRGKKAGIGATRDQIMLRDRASETTRHWLGELESSVIIAGDFNLPCDSAIYRKHWSEFGDAFSEAGWGWGLTKQTKWFGVRIDHVIYGNRWKCRKCWVGPDVGSDHLPVIAELEAVRAE